MNEVPVPYKVAALVEDMELYPRSTVDAHNVAKMRESIRAGVKLDPIIADAKTKVVSDGFHRRRAILAELGPDADHFVVFRDYANRQDILLDSAKINDRHGLRLSESERVQFAVRAQELGISTERIAEVLSVMVDTVSNWMVKRVGTEKISLGRYQKVALKPSMRHLAGSELTHEQVEANSAVAGNRLSFMAKQVRILVESDSVDWTNEPSVKELVRLHKVLADRIERGVKAFNKSVKKK